MADEIPPVVIVPIVPVEPVTPEAVETAIDDTQDDVDLVAEMVAAEGIQSELRHDQILEGVAECRAQLESLSISPTPTESPLLNAMMARIEEIHVRVTALQSEVQKIQELKPNSSNPPVSPSEESVILNPAVLNAEPSTEGPKPDAVPKKYRRL